MIPLGPTVLCAEFSVNVRDILSVESREKKNLNICLLCRITCVKKLDLKKNNKKFNICFFCYSGLNFQDLMVRQGAIDSPPKTPFILGFECSGDIEQVGENVKDFKVRTFWNTHCVILRKIVN